MAYRLFNDKIVGTKFPQGFYPLIRTDEKLPIACEIRRPAK